MAKHPTTIEKDYARKLRKIAKVVGHIIEAHTVINEESIVLRPGLEKLLRDYSGSLEPFARNIANEMLNRVDKNNAKWWYANAKEFSKALQSERFQTANGIIANKMQEEQVHLIKSLPVEAGLRAQRLATQATTEGRRASEVAEEIMRSEDVTASRANTIARTEVARANAKFTESRARYVGATNYIWHTMEDENVRESHADMDGKICSFDNPPTLEDGDEGNPGEVSVNCRCYAEPIIGAYEDDED